MGDDAFEGGCLCGAVRFRATGPARNACLCHCRSCRLAAGAPSVAWATFATDAFRLLEGELAEHRSSPPVQRGFCARCGTSITYAHEGRPGELDVALATLDDPSLLRPACHIWVSDKLPWVATDDGLPCFPELPESG